jgi:hypothetical protein
VRGLRCVSRVAAAGLNFEICDPGLVVGGPWT